MRFDLVLRNKMAYTYEGYVSRHVASVFEKKRIPFKMVYLSEGLLNDYLSYLKEDSPTCMLSFSDPISFERPFCDIVHVPQFVWVRTSLSEAAHYLNSPYATVGVPFHSSHPKTLYLAHGVERASLPERLFDTVYFSSLIDLKQLEMMWEDFFPREMIEMIYKALDTDLPAYEAALEVAAEKPVSLSHLIEAIETYRKAKRTYEVITTFEGDSLDLFGKHRGNQLLKKLPKGVRLHYSLPYTEYLEVLKQSKQVILDPLDAHWYFPALGFGCKVIGYTSEESDPPSWERQINQLVEHLLKDLQKNV